MLLIIINIMYVAECVDCFTFYLVWMMLQEYAKGRHFYVYLEEIKYKTVAFSSREKKDKSEQILPFFLCVWHLEQVISANSLKSTGSLYNN